MNGMMTGNNTLDGLTKEDLLRLLAIIKINQQQGMLQNPITLAQGPNQLQQMVGVRGDGVSSQTKAGIEKNLPGFYGTQPVEPVPAGYSLGSPAPGQLDLEQRQRNASAARLGLPSGKNYSDDEIRAATLRRNSAGR